MSEAYLAGLAIERLNGKRIDVNAIECDQFNKFVYHLSVESCLKAQNTSSSTEAIVIVTLMSRRFVSMYSDLF